MSDNSTYELLMQIGLSQTEASTYIAMLSLDTISIRKISEQTGINRGTTHEILKQLVKRGLVSTRKTGEREYYLAESPNKITDIIKDLRKDLLHAQKLAEEVVPELNARKAQTNGKPLVRYYEDDEGVAAILRDVLQTCRQLDNPEYCVYSSRSLRQYIYRKFPNFTDRRIAEGIFVRVLAVGKGGDPAVDSARKWLPNASGEASSSYVIIYDNKLAQISISSDRTPYGVVIEDEGVAEMQRTMFEHLWTTV